MDAGLESIKVGEDRHTRMPVIHRAVIDPLLLLVYFRPSNTSTREEMG